MRVRVRTNRTLYSPVNADVPPGLPDQELSWGRVGCCPSWHELGPWAGLQAASGGERAVGVDQGQHGLLESTRRPWPAGPCPEFKVF